MTQSDREARAGEKARAVCPLGHDRLIVSGDCPGCESITQALLSFDQEREAELAQARAELARLKTNPLKDLSDDELVALACTEPERELARLRTDLEKAKARLEAVEKDLRRALYLYDNDENVNGDQLIKMIQQALLGPG